MSDALEQRLRNTAEVSHGRALTAALLREAAAELARLREALAQAERERDNWHASNHAERVRANANEEWARTMERERDYCEEVVVVDERQKVEDAEADLAACRGQLELLVAALTYASEGWADAPDVARTALAAAEEPR